MRGVPSFSLPSTRHSEPDSRFATWRAKIVIAHVEFRPPRGNAAHERIMSAHERSSVVRSRGSLLPARSSVVRSRGSLPPARSSVVRSRGSLPPARSSVVRSRGSLLPARSSVVRSRGSLPPARSSVARSRGSLLPARSSVVRSRGSRSRALRSFVAFLRAGAPEEAEGARKRDSLPLGSSFERPGAARGGAGAKGANAVPIAVRRPDAILRAQAKIAHPRARLVREGMSFARWNASFAGVPPTPVRLRTR